VDQRCSWRRQLTEAMAVSVTLQQLSHGGSAAHTHTHTTAWVDIE
jgi:hypothetical protein